MGDRIGAGVIGGGGTADVSSGADILLERVAFQVHDGLYTAVGSKGSAV